MKKLVLFVMMSMALSMHAQMDLPDCLQTSSYFKRGYIRLVENMLLPSMEAETTYYREDWTGGRVDTYDDLTYGRIWGLIVLPSFSPEESLYCVQRGAGYKLIMRIPEENIWYAARPILYDRIDTSIKELGIKSVRDVRNTVRWEDVKLDVKVNELQLDITREQAQMLSNLFRMAIRTATPIESYTIKTDENGKKFVQEGGIGLDGTTTTFFCDGRAAECWSPEGGKLKRLCNLAYKLCNAVKHSDKDQVQSVLPEAQKLTLEFKELLPNWAKEYLDLPRK